MVRAAAACFVVVVWLSYDTQDVEYEINPSLELSLLDTLRRNVSWFYVFFCLTTHDSDCFGWIMVAGGDRLIPDPPAPV